MRAVKGSFKKYWKYVAWTQPVLSSNTSSSEMQVSATNEGQGAAWKAFDGNESTYCTTSNYVTTQKITVTFAQRIYISQVDVVGLSNQYGHTNSVTINGETKSYNYSVSNKVTFDFSSYFGTNILEISGTGSNWVGILEIYITAYTIEPGTAEDYDFYTEYKYALPKEIITVFWKYVSQAFNFVFSGTRSTQGWQSASQGSNYLSGGSNAYEMGQGAYTQLMWTYTNTIPANTYSFNVYISGQGNGYFNNPTVVVTYSDNTTETVYTKSWGGSSLNESFTFTASKPIKSIKATGTLTHSSVTYVGINLTLTSLTHLAPIESTEDDYDYTTQEERLCGFK